VWRVGNVMVDTLVHSRRRAAANDVLDRLGLPGGEHVLLTLHRPANVDVPEVLRDLVRIAVEVSRDRAVVFPVHPRAETRLVEAGLMDDLAAAPGVVLTPPLGYLECLRLQDTAHAVMTDSGGLQEESTVLGVPCLTLRDSTERPVTVTEGTNRVVGTDPAAVLSAYREVARPHAPRVPEGWDGRAAERIANVLSTVAPPLSGERPDRSMALVS